MKMNILGLIILLFFLSCNVHTNELIPFSLNGKYGYVNSDLKVIIEPKFFSAGHFTENGYAIVSYYDSTGMNLKGGIINKEGEIIVESNSRQIFHVFEDIYAVDAYPFSESNIIRLRDKNIIAKQASVSGSTSKDGYILAIFPYEENYFQFIDFEGNRVLNNLNMKNPSYSFFEKRAVILNENWDPVIIDMEGRKVGNLLFNCIDQKFSEGLVPAQTTDGVTGYVNLDGVFEFTIPFVVSYGPAPFPEATSFSGGYAAIKTNNNPSVWKIINKNGQVISGDILVTQIREFSSDLSLVSVYNIDINKNKYGYINTKGEFFVAPVFEYADSFHNGYARIIYEGRDGLINTEGTIFWCDEIVNNNQG